jgi:phenylalanyl-tRNA synthetase beta chain
MPRPRELVNIEPFDRVESGPFPESKYSLAISLWYQSNERTLTDAEVEELHSGVLRALAANGMEQRK